MDSTGEQLHPNWRALTTIHIPLKRFIKEGDQQTQQGTHCSNGKDKYEIKGCNGHEIKEFYEEMIKKEDVNKAAIVKTSASKSPKTRNVDKKEPFDIKRFHRLAMENNVEELKKMDFQGQDVNVCDRYGWTALMMAACEGALNTVKFLLEMGVNREAKNAAGQTAKDIARKKGHFHLDSLLEKPFAFTSEHEESSDEAEDIEPFYCGICKRTFTESSQKQHQTSTVHQFNAKSSPNTKKLQKFNIPPRNRGLQLMVKQGWDKESGLGPTQTGRLYPVKTVIRKQRTGLGIEQDAARVTHFQAFDKRAVQRQNSDYYRKKSRNRNDIQREKVREWKRNRRLRNELS